MDVTKPKTEEIPRKRRNRSKPICRKTGDHVHYPPQTRSKRPLHAPSANLKTGFIHKVIYGECRKNQAADIGATAYDGCGEFVTGEDFMNCAACNCHRSFHLELDGVSSAVIEVLKLSSDQFRKIFCSPYDGENGQVKEETRKVLEGIILVEEEEEEEGEGKAKRVKAKFTADQTVKMRNYAEKLQWRVRVEDRKEIDEFCSEIGVNPNKFRIWINNHKDKNNSTGEKPNRSSNNSRQHHHHLDGSWVLLDDA